MFTSFFTTSCHEKLPDILGREEKGRERVLLYVFKNNIEKNKKMLSLNDT